MAESSPIVLVPGLGSSARHTVNDQALQERGGGDRGLSAEAVQGGGGCAAGGNLINPVQPI